MALTPIEILFERMVNQGIIVAVDALVETSVEVSTISIASKLNEIKWAGKDNWASDFLESYIENLRGNLNSAIIGNLMSSRIARIQGESYAIFKMEKISNGLGSLWDKFSGMVS